MKEKLIDFETAKLAHSKGFDVIDKINTSYSSTTSLNGEIKSVGIKLLITWIDCWKKTPTDTRYNYTCLRPTQSFLQKWLREVKNIDCHAMPVRFTGEIEVGYYTYAVRSIQPVGRQKYKFDTWEEALEQGLQEALKLIKNEN